jgi:hypothetical protein
MISHGNINYSLSQYNNVVSATMAVYTVSHLELWRGSADTTSIVSLISLGNDFLGGN